MASVISHLINNELPSRNGVRVAEALCDAWNDYIPQADLGGQPVFNVRRMHHIVRIMDDIFTFPKTIEGCRKTWRATEQCRKDWSQTDNTRTRRVAFSILMWSKAFVNLLKNSVGALKFLGAWSIVPFLASKTQILGTVKSVYSIYIAVVDGGIGIWQLYKLSNSNKRQAQVVEGLSILRCICVLILKVPRASPFISMHTLTISTLTKHMCKFSIIFSTITCNTINATRSP